MAETLVRWVSQAAEKHGITHRGENALACVGDEDPPYDNRSWDRIGKAFTDASYSGFTFLRLTRRPDAWDCVPWNAVDQERYKAFIQRYVSTR